MSIAQYRVQEGKNNSPVMWRSMATMFVAKASLHPQLPTSARIACRSKRKQPADQIHEKSVKSGFFYWTRNSVSILLSLLLHRPSSLPLFSNFFGSGGQHINHGTMEPPCCRWLWADYLLPSNFDLTHRCRAHLTFISHVCVSGYRYR
jgi:hypothetical protein